MNKAIAALCVIGLAVCGLVIYRTYASFKRAEEKLRASLKAGPEEKALAAPTTETPRPAGMPPAEERADALTPDVERKDLSVEAARSAINGFLSKWDEACRLIEGEREAFASSFPPEEDMDAISAFLSHPSFHSGKLRDQPHLAETEAVVTYLSAEYFNEKKLDPKKFQIALPHYPKYRIVKIALPYVDVIATTRERIIKNEYITPRSDRLTFKLTEEDGEARIEPSATMEFDSGQKAVSPQWWVEWMVNSDQYPEEAVVE